MAAINCAKVEPKDHLAAYLEERQLVRDIEPLTCDDILVEKLISNYIIVKQILSHLSWQDQLICKLVSQMWCQAVRALQKEYLTPQDFVVVFNARTNKILFKKSGSVPTEPMAIFTFTNFTGFSKLGNCNLIKPAPCNPVCDNKHLILDCIDQELCYPKECMVIVEATDLSYLPLANSVTSKHTFTHKNLHTNESLLCGVFIPKIPDVQFDVINIKGNTDMKKDFFDVVDKIAETHVVKGLLVFVTDKYLLNSLDDMTFLEYFKKIQTTPYAMGGCIIEDAIYERSDLSYFVNKIGQKESPAAFVSENVVSMAMFSVPKESASSGGNRSNFDMYSLVIESCDWSKAKIQKTVREFSESVPQFEHSVVFKLTCVGRDARHDFEQDTFRSYFPTTPLIGCYGNGELGVNHPTRPEPKAPLNTVKRMRKDSAHLKFMYLYSTVYVYCGWGKIKST